MSKNSAPFIFNCYQSSINTVEQVIQQMELLDAELEESTLENLRAFNTTYLLITKAVYAKLSTGYFENDQLMQDFDVIFAHYYFIAVYDFVKGHPVPPAWKILFDSCPKSKLFQLHYMALGVNAHVNNDLAQALNDMPQNSHADFLKINTVINTTLSEVVQQINEKNKIINAIKSLTYYLYKPVLYLIIKKWRNTAWNNYQYLRLNQITKDQIEKHAVKVANYLSSLHSGTV